MENPKNVVPQVNLMGKDRVIEHFGKIKIGLNKVKLWQSEFQTTNDKRTEDRLRENIKTICEQINSYVQSSGSTIDRMEKEVNRLKQEWNDPNCFDTSIRILAFTTATLQKKLCIHVTSFNELQTDIKRSYTDKMKRQLLSYDPNLDEDSLKGLVKDPLVESTGNEQVCDEEDLQEQSCVEQCSQ